MPTSTFPYAESDYSARVIAEPTTDGQMVFSSWYEELPGGESQGDIIEEARENLRKAFNLYVSDMIARGLRVPPPAHPHVREAAWYNYTTLMPRLYSAAVVKVLLHQIPSRGSVECNVVTSVRAIA